MNQTEISEDCLVRYLTQLLLSEPKNTKECDTDTDTITVRRIDESKQTGVEHNITSLNKLNKSKPASTQTTRNTVKNKTRVYINQNRSNKNINQLIIKFPRDTDTAHVQTSYTVNVSNIKIDQSGADY